uniref:SAM-dependent methyltransferase n=1 Tax=Ascaris lumbricoides TaxID=6252 RepID=A0A0M3HWC3_ASCLU
MGRVIPMCAAGGMLWPLPVDGKPKSSIRTRTLADLRPPSDVYLESAVQALPRLPENSAFDVCHVRGAD